MRTALLLTLLWLILFGTHHSASAQYIPGENTCHNTESEFYRPVYPIYEYRNRRIVLKDIATRADVQEVEINLELPEIRLSWSPNCRFLLGRLDAHNSIVWDALNGGRVITFENVGNVAHWSPDDNYAVVQGAGTFLWHVPSNTLRMLSNDSCPLWQLAWDFERGQMLAVYQGFFPSQGCSFYISTRNVFAYDLATGNEIRAYANLSYWVSIFDISDDNQYLIIYSPRVQRAEPFAVWDRDTGLGIFAETVWPYDKAPSVNSDGTYVAADGYSRVQIWDIRNKLSDPVQAEPIYVLQVRGETNVRWINPTVIEIISFRGTEYFDVTSGTYIDAP